MSATFEEIKQLRRQVDSSILRMPGVMGVATGFKKVGGKRTKELAVIIYVAKKLDLDRLPFFHTIPSSLNIRGVEVKTDIIEVVPFDSIAQIEEQEGLSVLNRSGAITYIGLDTLRGLPTEDKRVRQAMNYAVNAGAIAEFILSGRAQAVPGGLWPVSPGWDPDLPFYNDKEKAKGLLAEAGYPDGFEIKFNIAQVQGMLQYKEVAEAVQTSVLFLRDSKHESALA